MKTRPGTPPNDPQVPVHTHFTDFDVYPQPEWNERHSLCDALTGVMQASDYESSSRAYNFLLYAIGNNHAGTYYPVVLAVIPRIQEILLTGKPWPQHTALEVLIDLCTSFAPELGYETFHGVSLSAAVRDGVLALKPYVESVAGGTGVAANSARELLGCLNEKTCWAERLTKEETSNTEPDRNMCQPAFWADFLSKQIAAYGPDNQHPSYRYPGQALELVERWRSLSKSDTRDQALDEQLRSEIYEFWRIQECPVHTMWNDILRGFERWAGLPPRF